MIKKKILIASGGSGGHIFPGYSLANYYKDKNFSVEFTTDKRGLEYLRNYKNLNLIIIPSSPLAKKNFLKLIFSIFYIAFSIMKSLGYLLFNRPSIIIGMGGYSSFPICVAAYILRVKFVIYENNLIIGKANKFLLPFANKLFVSYKEIEGIPEKYSNKVKVLGNIIRKEIMDFNFSYKKKDFDSIRILVLGGSQGAKIFAQELPQIFEKLNNKFKKKIKIFQQCQRDQNAQLSEFYERVKIEHEIFNFTNEIINYYHKANLVITRSGASALGELINYNIPFISIPLPTSVDNHQYKNAEFYAKKGFGFFLHQKNIKDNLYDLIYKIFNDNSLIETLLTNQRQHSDKDIFNSLNLQIEKILDEKN